MSEKQPETNKKIEQQIITFLLITFGLSSIFYYFLAYDGKLFAGGGLYILGLMCCPGLSAIITQLIYSKNLRNFGWGWGNTKYQIWSFAIPFLYALVTYTIIWNTGLGRFYNGDFGDSVSDDLSKIVGISNQSSYVLIEFLVYCGFCYQPWAKKSAGGDF